MPFLARPGCPTPPRPAANGRRTRATRGAWPVRIALLAAVAALLWSAPPAVGRNDDPVEAPVGPQGWGWRAWRPGHCELVGLRRKAGRESLEGLDPETGAVRTLVDLTAVRERVGRRGPSPRGIGRRAAPGFVWEPGGQGLCVVAGGDLAWVDLAASTTTPRRLTHTVSPLSDVQVAPGGGHVAFHRDHEVWAVPTAGGEARALTSGGSAEVLHGGLDWVLPEELDLASAIWWAPDGERLAFLRVDQRQVPRRPLVTRPTWNTPVRWMHYPRAGEANPRVSIGVVGLDGGPPRWLDLGQPGPEYVARVAWFPDGQHLAVTTLDRTQRRVALLACPISGEPPTEVLVEEDPAWVDVPPAPRFTDARHFLWRSHRDGRTRWYWASLPQGPPGAASLTPLTAAGVDAYEPPHFEPATGRVLYTAEADGGLRRRVFAGSEIAPFAQLGDHDAAAELDPSGAWALVTWGATHEPNRVDLRHTRELGRVQRIATSTPSAFDPDLLPRFEIGEVSQPTPVTWRLWTPRDLDVGRKHPLLVLVYGGPGTRRIQDRWDPGRVAEVNGYLARGWLVLEADGRGTRGRGTLHERAVAGRLGVLEAEDQARAVEHVARRPWIDAARVGITGWSFGGTVTCLALLRPATPFCAGVAVAPVTDWSLYDTIYTERYMGLPTENPTGYAAASIVAQVEHLGGRLLVHHGLADDNVHVANTLQLVAAAQTHNVRALEARIYPDAGHGLGRHGREVRQRTLLFLRGEGQD